MGATDRWIRGVRSPLGRLRRSIRSFLDGRLHPHRRGKTLRQLTAHAEGIRRILFICHGNICRSPYAEARLRHSARERDLPLEVTSAGFLPGGGSPPPEALQVASERALDLSEHRSRALTAEAVAAADLVMVMEPRQASRLPEPGTGRPRVMILGDLDPAPVDRRSILDPWGEDLATFERVFARIDRCTGVLLDALATAGAGRGAGAGPVDRQALRRTLRDTTPTARGR